jgi:hypothetical protein
MRKSDYNKVRKMTVSARRDRMKKAEPQMKRPTITIKKKPTVKKEVKEPLAEGFIQEPHADYGSLNNDLDKAEPKK